MSALDCDFYVVLGAQDAGPDGHRRPVRPPRRARPARAGPRRQRDDQGSLDRPRAVERPAVALRAGHAAHRRGGRAHGGGRVPREARHGPRGRARGRARGARGAADSRRSPACSVFGPPAGERARGGRGVRGRWPASARRRRAARRRGHRRARRASLRDAAHALPRGRRDEPRELLGLHARRTRSTRSSTPSRGCARSCRSRCMQPRNPFVSPRFGQVATFMLLPWAESPAGLDVALLGIPYDGGTSYRTGARFGPRAVREQSSLIRSWHPVLKVHPFERPARRRLRRRRRRADLDRADVRGDRAARSTRCSRRARSRSAWAATTRSRCRSCARSRAATARSASSTSTRIPTRGTSTSARSSSTARRSGARSRKARSIRGG